ncbi:MAG: TonB-dependent receptor [Verrucomicrobiaceae bacterium]|nr:TonB-dependent receptor [Verrucomicrobiaceae bacterium]
MRSILFFTFATAVCAADPLPEVVVTATRSENEAKKLPSLVKTLDAKKVEERQPRTFPEALRETPGVAIQKTSNGQGSPFIRGFTGFRNLLLVDGIRYNNSTFREGPNQYWALLDPFAMERIEVIPSQGSVLYGSDAIGGTVNAISKSSGFGGEAAGSFFTHGLASYRWSSAEHSHIEHLEASIGEGQKWGLHLGGTFGQFGDVKPGQGPRQPRTGYDQWAFDVRLDIALDDQWLLTAVHQQSRMNDVWRTHSTNQGTSFEGTTNGTDRVRLFDQERSLSYLRLAGKDLGGWIDEASLTVSLQTQGEEQFRVTGAGVRSFNDVDLTTLGVDLQLESRTAIGKLVYGVDFYHDWVESDATDNINSGAVADDSTYSLLGIFLQDEVDFGDRLHLVAGGRYTHVRADAGKFTDPVTGTRQSFSDEWDNFSANLRLMLDLDSKDRFQLFGGWSQSFRAPNLSDLSRDDLSGATTREAPATGLNPELYNTFEIGLKAQTDSITASLGYFYTRINDMIVRRPTGRVVGGRNEMTKSNADDGYMQGVEFSANWQIDPNWSVFGHVAWVDGEADQFIGNSAATRREPLGKVAPLVGYGGVRWQTTSKKVWTELVCLTYGEAARMNASDLADTDRIPANGTPSFWLVTLRGGWQVNDHLILNAGIENILNETYRYHGSGSNEPGLGVNLGATVKF